VSKDVAIAQIITTITTIFYAGVFAIGYYLLIKVNRETLKEIREQRISGGRPQVIIQARYDRLPTVDLVVRNFGGGVAKDITFVFSEPIEDSTGFILSELPYFQEGMRFLGPGEEVACAWDNLDNLASSLRQKGHDGGILVKVSYEDLAGESYETEWRINPLIYEGNRHVPSQDRQAVQALLSALTRVSENEARNQPRGRLEQASAIGAIGGRAKMASTQSENGFANPLEENPR
jgi:hypothetical protein